MASKVKVLILRTAGTNCDQETAAAFEVFGAALDLVHVNELLARKKDVRDYHILAIPGGFTYGDDIAAGRILANELRLKLGEDIQRFLADGKLMLGICNGFQVLVKAGFLPGSQAPGVSPVSGSLRQQVTLMTNDSAKYEDRWVHLKAGGCCVWTEGLAEQIFLPVAHGEGKFVVGNQETLDQLTRQGQIVLQYVSPQGGDPLYPQNPNGSMAHVAGITDPTGRILGLMPHPERHFFFEHHPCWTRLKRKSKFGDGAQIFENGVKYARNHLV